MGNTQTGHGELLARYQRWMRVQRDNKDSTVKLKTKETQKFLRWLDDKDVDIDDVDQDTLNQYVDECRERYSPNTMVTVTANLRTLLIHFLDKGLELKTAKPKPPDRDKTPLTRDEVDQIFETAKSDPLAEAILKTLYYTGVRRFELENMDLRDVDFDRRRITIRYGKNDEERVVNIATDCALALQRYIERRPAPQQGHEEALLLTRKGERIKRSTIRTIVKRHAAKAGIERHVYPHLFRITMITHMAEAGLSPKEIQAQSGHKTIKTLLGYIQHTPQRMRNAYDGVFESDEFNAPEPDEDVLQSYEEVYKKKLLKKYSVGEIDVDTLHNLLSSIESAGGQPTHVDMAYG